MLNYLTYVVVRLFVAAVKCRTVIYHCVVIFFWSSRIIDWMLFILENRVPLMNALGGVSSVASFITMDGQL